MNDNDLFIYQNIVSNMNEGVLTINENGRITSVNSSAERILSMDKTIIGKAFASVFFVYSENDGFNQAVLDAVYDGSVSHNVVVDYYDGKKIKRLFMNTSFLINDGKKIGVTAVFNDITELAELQDAVKAMERIKALNGELNKRNEFIKKTFGRYLSDEIVNELLETEDGLEIGGKKQYVTVMFTDIRGFTAVSERMKPRDLITMLNHYLGCMIEIISRHSGTILEFIGDAIVVVFGAPVEKSGTEGDAVRCAVEMQCAMKGICDWNRENGFPVIEMGIGIHSGDVILGNIGSEKKSKYDIIGKNVNLASRIESFTVGGQIFVSSAVREQLCDFETGREVQILPKGVNHPVTIYEVLRLGNYRVPAASQHFKKIAPVSVKLYRLEGKFMSDEAQLCEVCELSEKQAKITFGSGTVPLEENSNVRMCFGTDFKKEVYAKVISSDESSAVLHITMGSF